jgi:endonuclease YncB( thermonuclease family)
MTSSEFAGAQFSPAGRVITRKALAECKRQARARKLGYFRQRQFLRECVAQ